MRSPAQRAQTVPNKHGIGTRSHKQSGGLCSPLGAARIRRRAALALAAHEAEAGQALRAGSGVALPAVGHRAGYAAVLMQAEPACTGIARFQAAAARCAVGDRAGRARPRGGVKHRADALLAAARAGAGAAARVAALAAGQRGAVVG